MASLGQELKEEREARHISIEEIASATKIVRRYLEALEADHLEILPGEFFIKGIIRNYARAIGLDGEAVLAKYKAAGYVGEPERKRHLLQKPEPAKSERAPSATTAPKPEAEPVTRPSLEVTPEQSPAPPVETPAPEPAETPAPKPGPALDPAERLIVKSAPESPRPSRLKRFMEALFRTRAVVLWGLGALVVLAIVFLLVLPLTRRPRQPPAGVAVPAPVAAETVAPPAQEPATEPPPAVEVVWKGVTIEISFQADTWIEVHADGVLKVEGLFPPGTKAKAQANEGLLIHTGNAGGFSFLLNGKPAKSLGRSGQVITDIKITPENFKDFLEAETTGRPAG